MARKEIPQVKETPVSFKLTCGKTTLIYNSEDEEITIDSDRICDECVACDLNDLLELKAVIDKAVEKNFFNEEEK